MVVVPTHAVTAAYCKIYILNSLFNFTTEDFKINHRNYKEHSESMTRHQTEVHKKHNFKGEQQTKYFKNK